MPIFVQGNANDQSGSSATTAQTFSSPQTAGNTNIVIVAQFSGTTTTTVSSLVDSAGNVYQLLQGGLISGTQGPAYLYWCPRIVASVSNTVTATWSAAVTFSELIILEYNLGNPLAALSVTGIQASGTSLTIGPIVLAVSGLTATWARAGTTPPIGYTQRTAASFGLYYDNTTASAGANSVTWGGSTVFGFLLGLQPAGYAAKSAQLIDTASYRIDTSAGITGGIATFQEIGPDGVARNLATPAPITLLASSSFTGKIPGQFHGLQMLVSGLAGGTITFSEIKTTTRQGFDIGGR